MIVYHHTRQLVVQEFFPERSDFPGKQQNWISSVFTVLPKHVKIKSLLKYKSVCGRVGLSPALISNRPNIRPSLNGACFTYHFFFNFELVYFLSAFHY